MATNVLPPVEVRCISDNPYAAVGIVNSKRARLEIETRSSQEDEQKTKRNPINLVLVLDRSGSMSSNNKLEFAKKAVISVLDLLQDDDVVQLIAYDDTVWNVFENARGSARETLHSVVNGIKAGGNTNLSGGIAAGAELFEKYAHPGFSKRMFVLSDGLANVGVQSKEGIKKEVTKYEEQGVIIDSFGIGEDFDEAMMKGIAQAGHGQFFFLESAEVIVPLMTKAVQSVFDVFGTRAQLIIRGRNNAIVTKIWGHENIALGANLGDLHVDNLRVLLCDFTVSASVPNGTELEVLDYQLKYNLPDDLDGEVQVVEGTLRLTFIDDESLLREINPKVRTLHAVQVAGEMDDRIAVLIENHQRDQAIALIDEQITLLREVEHLDDEKGMIAMLVRMAENMQNRLKQQKVSQKTAGKYYGHHGHLKKCYDYKYAHHYADDD